MAVDSIEAGVAGGSYEPAAVNAHREIENAGRRFIPSDVRGGFRPEAERIALGAGIDFVIAAFAEVRLGYRSCAQFTPPRGPPCALAFLCPKATRHIRVPSGARRKSTLFLIMRPPALASACAMKIRMARRSWGHKSVICKSHSRAVVKVARSSRCRFEIPALS